MAQTRGLIKSVSEDGWARVVVARNTACGGCASSGGCHGCLANAKMEIKVLNKTGANVGDLVSVSLSSEMVLKGAAVLYLLPVGGLLIGAAAGAWINQIAGISDSGFAIIMSFIGLLLGFSATALLSKRMSANDRMIPAISRIIQGNPRSRSSVIDTRMHVAIEIKD